MLEILFALVDSRTLNIQLYAMPNRTVRTGASYGYRYFNDVLMNPFDKN